LRSFAESAAIYALLLLFSTAVVPKLPSAPAAADTIYGFFQDSGTGPSDYDRIFTGDLGRIGSRLLRDLLAERGIDIDDRHSDCGVMIFDESQDVHAGGSGCGCCASVLCGKILGDMAREEYHNILFVPTGALLSPTTVMQKQTIPSVAHLVNIRI
jgi:stage V sporulation protein AD